QTVVAQFRRGKGGRSLRADFNQLALFTEGFVRSTTGWAAETDGNGNDGADRARREDTQALAGEHAGRGLRPGEEQTTGAGGGGGKHGGGRGMCCTRSCG